MNHDFHYVTTQKMKNRILKLGGTKNLTLSATIVYIFKKIEPILDRYHYVYPEDNEIGKYGFIDADADIHVYLGEEEYRKLKLIHATMNFFSMAIILRWIIKLFFDCIDKYGCEKFDDLIERYQGINVTRFYKGERAWKKAAYFEHMSQKGTWYELFSLTFTNNYKLLGFEILHYDYKT
jgi:hypothetical protein